MSHTRCSQEGLPRVYNRTKEDMDPATLWDLINRHATTHGTDSTELRLTYDAYRKITKWMSPDDESYYTNSLMSPQKFAHFHRDDRGTISADDFYVFVSKKALVREIDAKIEECSQQPRLSSSQPRQRSTSRAQNIDVSTPTHTANVPSSIHESPHASLSSPCNISESNPNTLPLWVAQAVKKHLNVLECQRTPRRDDTAVTPDRSPTIDALITSRQLEETNLRLERTKQEANKLRQQVLTMHKDHERALKAKEESFQKQWDARNDALTKLYAENASLRSRLMDIPTESDAPALRLQLEEERTKGKSMEDELQKAIELHKEVKGQVEKLNIELRKASDDHASTFVDYCRLQSELVDERSQIALLRKQKDEQAHAVTLANSEITRLRMQNDDLLKKEVEWDVEKRTLSLSMYKAQCLGSSLQSSPASTPMSSLRRQQHQQQFYESTTEKIDAYTTTEGLVMTAASPSPQRDDRTASELWKQLEETKAKLLQSLQENTTLQTNLSVVMSSKRCTTSTTQTIDDLHEECRRSIQERDATITKLKLVMTDSTGISEVLQREVIKLSHENEQMKELCSAAEKRRVADVLEIEAQLLSHKGRVLELENVVSAKEREIVQLESNYDKLTNAVAVERDTHRKDLDVFESNRKQTLEELTRKHEDALRQSQKQQAMEMQAMEQKCEALQKDRTEKEMRLKEEKCVTEELREKVKQFESQVVLGKQDLEAVEHNYQSQVKEFEEKLREAEIKTALTEHNNESAIAQLKIQMEESVSRTTMLEREKEAMKSENVGLREKLNLIQQQNTQLLELCEHQVRSMETTSGSSSGVTLPTQGIDSISFLQLTTLQECAARDPVASQCFALLCSKFLEAQHKTTMESSVEDMFSFLRTECNQRHAELVQETVKLSAAHTQSRMQIQQQEAQINQLLETNQKLESLVEMMTAAERVEEESGTNSNHSSVRNSPRSQKSPIGFRTVSFREAENVVPAMMHPQPTIKRAATQYSMTTGSTKPTTRMKAVPIAQSFTHPPNTAKK